MFMQRTALFLVFATACSEPLPERVDDGHGSFGEEVASLFCRRLDYHADLADGDGIVDVSGARAKTYCFGYDVPTSAPPQAQAFQQDRLLTEQTLDHLVPEDTAAKLQTILASKEVHLAHDDGVTRGAANALAEFSLTLSEDSESLTSIAHFVNQEGLSAKPGGMIAALTSSPEVSTSLAQFLAEVAPGGRARDGFSQMLTGVGASLRNFGAGDEQEILSIASDYLLSEQPLINGTSSPAVVLDERGKAKVTRVSGSWPMGLVDKNNDGLADTDGAGNFIDTNGQPVVVETPFPHPNSPGLLPRDSLGRVLSAPGGSTVYEYRDTGKTVMSALTRNAPLFFDPETQPLLNLLGGMQKMLGLRSESTRTYPNGEEITYQGFDGNDSPAMDLVHSLTTLLRHQEIDELLVGTRELFRTKESELAHFAEAAVATARRLDNYPNAVLANNQTLIDDLLPHLQAMAAHPGLHEQLIEELARPQTTTMMRKFAKSMKFRDKFTFGVNQQVVGDFTSPVDRSFTDSGSNRSLMQRILYLVSDSNRLKYCNKQGARVTDPLNLGIPIKTYDECALLQIDNVAVFFVQSIAYKKQNGAVVYDNGVPVRKAELPFNWDSTLIELLVTDNMMEDMVGIEGFRTHPTPEALTRVLLLDPAPSFLAEIADPVETKHGVKYTQVHSDALPSWEKDNFYSDLRPLVQVFADHDAEEILVDILTVLYQHWPSEDSTDHNRVEDTQGYAKASNLQSFEPFLIETLEDPDFVPSLVGLLQAVDATSAGGQPLARSIDEMVGFVLSEVPGLRTWGGDSEIPRLDGGPHDSLTPAHLMVYGLRRAQDAVASDVNWPVGTKGMVDALVRGENVSGWRFKNRDLVGLSIATIDLLRDRISEHDAFGDRDDWARQTLPEDALSMLTSPLTSGFFDMADGIPADVRRELSKVVSTILSDSDNVEAVVAGSATMIDLMAQGEEFYSVLRLVGTGITGDNGWADALVRLNHRLLSVDSEGVVLGIINRMFSDSGNGRLPVAHLSTVVASVSRDQPTQDASKAHTTADVQAIADSISGFFNDKDRGFPKIIRIIEERNR